MLQTATSLSMAEETELVAVSEVAKEFIYLQCLCALMCQYAGLPLWVRTTLRVLSRQTTDGSELSTSIFTGIMRMRLCRTVGVILYKVSSDEQLVVFLTKLEG